MMPKRRQENALAEYFKVAEWRILEWERDYAPLNVRQEIAKMHQWLEANPRRRKKRYERFVVNWLNKAHAQVVSAQVNARLYARVGAGTDRTARLRVDGVEVDLAGGGQ